MAPQPCLHSSASCDPPLGVSSSSFSVAKPSFDAFGQSSPTARHLSSSKVRIIRIFSPKLVTTDAANFRALVQKLTGKFSGPSDADTVRVRDPLKKIRREEKRRKKVDTKVPLAARKLIASTAGGERSNPTQTQYNALASKMFREGDMNSSESQSVESCISLENSESVDYLAFREVNVELPLFPPLTYDQDNCLIEDQCWRLTDADDCIRK